MAISPTTDWSKLRYIMFVIFFISDLMASTIAHQLTAAGKDKRQLFREHVLPQQGGKIPDGAFAPDRLMLNKFNQIGLFSLDGLYLEERQANRLNNHKTAFPNTLKLYFPVDDKDVAPAGRQDGVRTVDTTYLIRDPVNYPLNPIRPYSDVPVTPIDSLKIWHRFKLRQANSNNVQDPTFQKTAQEFAPYLRQLHKFD